MRWAYWALLTIGTLSTNGPIVARLFVSFSLHTVLGWVMLGWAIVLAVIGSVHLVRQRAGIPTPRCGG